MALLDHLPSEPDALAQRYARGRQPDPLEGAYTGRLFPVRWSRLLRALAPWEGKTLGPGRGRNRLRGLGERFPFRIQAGRSALDGEACLILDYDLPDNPRPIRRLLDELRELEPGLYLGPGFLRVGGRRWLWTWFALAGPAATAPAGSGAALR